jgi:molecular chaperone GrpE
MTENKKSFFEITAKAVILNEKDEILLLKRSKEYHHGAEKWDLPGGKLEAGENIEKGLLREIKEELGISVDLGPIIYICDFEKKYDRKIEISSERLLIAGKGIRFIAYYKEGEIKLSNEHGEFKWLPMKEALKNFGDTDFEKDKKVSLAKAEEYIELIKSLDGWKRCQADLENYKKEQARRMEDFRDFTRTDFLMQILPVLDNFHASTEHVPVDQKNSPWVSGIMHIQKQLEQVLKDGGVSEIEVKVGDEFNPEMHEAVASEQESESSEQKNNSKIKKIVQKGYRMNGKIIRAAKVIAG